jgi:hypothetical protein
MKRTVAVLPGQAIAPIQKARDLLETVNRDLKSVTG